MTTESDKHRLWYESVVQPKLQVLLDLSQGSVDFHSFDHAKFFKEFLADLELLTLDNYTSEAQVDRISAALDVLKKNAFDESQFPLRDIALIASCKSSVDRLLFYSEWKKYQRYIKTHGPVSDEALVDAFRMSALLKMFVQDITLRASVLIVEAQERSNQEVA